MHMELWVTTSDVNLKKLILLEVHGRLGNAKIAKKMSEWDVPYIGKLIKRDFQQAKERANRTPD